MNLELSDEERDTLIQLRAIENDRFPLALRLRPIRAVLDKLAPLSPRGKGADDPDPVSKGAIVRHSRHLQRRLRCLGDYLISA